MTAMQRRSFLAGAAGLLAGTAAGGMAASGRRKPNFLVVLCDDLGFGDLGVTGNRIIRTPNIDRMAARGVRMNNFYSAANLCTPSRAGLLTGRYAVRTGLGYQVILEKDDRFLPKSEVTIAKALQPTGYVSGLFGKWHLGHVGDWSPVNYGFDQFFGLQNSHDMEPRVLFSHRRGGSLTQEPIVYPQLQQRLYMEAERFLEEHRARPFFLELALTAPHLPEHPNPAFRGRSGAGAYGDVVEEVDAMVGRLLDKLRQLGLEQDTLVLFTSDNGPWYEGSAGVLRQRKGGGGYDGGFKAPLIAYQPGTVRQGATVDGIGMAIDFLPTFCAMAGTALPNVTLDGRDIGALLTGRGGKSPHDELVLFDNEDPIAIRTQRWKYVAADYYRARLFPTDVKYPQLYDVAADPSETYSLADRYPAVLQDMKSRLDRARKTFAPFKSPEIPAAFRNRLAATSG